MLARASALMAAGRDTEASLIVHQLAARNDPAALCMLGHMKWAGKIVPPNPAEGRDLYRRAAEHGDASAATFHTNLLASGIAGPRDWKQAISRLRDEARKDRGRRDALALVDRMKLTPDGDPVATPQGERLSESPEVTFLPRLFSSAECDYLKLVAEPHYQPSTVYDSSRVLRRDPIRTSDGAAIHWLIEDPAVHALNRRLAAASGSRAEQGEAIQILRYRPGEEYRPHFDFVRSSENQRSWTALVWLNHDYQGGETCFLRTGLKVKGVKGDAIFFRNAGADGGPDPMSEHAGLPVTSGTKYLASRWIREKKWHP
jgi:prolyl 4-hydroxylase